MIHIAARMALAAEPEGQRQAERRPVSVRTTMRALGYHGGDVIVSDISELGFRAETNAEYREGSYVRLKLPAIGIVLARIAWCSGTAVGGEFVHPIPVSQLRLLIGFGGFSVRETESLPPP